MEEVLKQETKPNFVEGSILKGRVIEKRDNGVLVDIQYKSEGFISSEEFKNWNDIKPDDMIDVFLEQIEDENNMPKLSVSKASFQKSWDKLCSEYKEGQVIKGLMKHRVKGGIIVDLFGIEAFLPGSQLDIAPVRNMDDFIGKEYDLKILKINTDRKNIVVSRRELLEADRADKRSTLLKDMEKGQVRNGVVKNITDFGAFIDLGGLDGLLHITDMSWKRISHPSEMLEIGQRVDAVILDIDNVKERVSLGLKQKTENPWIKIDEKYPVGATIKGRVVNIMPYGAFVEIAEGVEGLIHVSEMSWTKRITKAGEVLSVGEEVEAVVLDIQKDQKKISLGLRQTTQNPWEVLAQKYPAGSKIKGKVRNMTSYGAFVEIENDIDGMIHVSDMSWTRKINNPNELLKVGQEVEAVILDIDPAQQRISLGIKQLENDPWLKIDELYKIGDLLKGKITKITAFGAFIELSNKIDGLIHISQISDEHVKRVKDVLTLGDEVEARVIKIDRDERRIGLSIKAAKANYSEEALKAAGEEVAAALGNIKVGEMLDEDSLSALDAVETSIRKEDAERESKK
ncbi:MAG: 30S ribosomal protein S1 [Lentisphaerae bacterium GWF2_49_21]|nr:MAG: 30S ribosomal protein S1 [Lentisphaerae bacterium GWF2_49_21]